jgi:hypothetical protein
MSDQIINFLQSPEGARYLGSLLSGGGTTEKDSGVTGGVIPPHGPNALFNVPGVSPGIVATIVRPNGLEDFLERAGHVRLSQDTNPLFGIMTGQTASTGTEPTDPCSENVPVPGDLKMCFQTWTFGEMTMKSKPIRVDDAGQLINRSEPLDLRLLNNPFGDLPDVTTIPAGELFRSKLAKAVSELSLDFRRRYARLIWTGSPVNTAGNTGGYVEFNGLDRVVNTGYTNVINGIACSAADSYVVDAALAIIQNTANATVTRYREAWRSRRKLEEDVGLSGVEYAFVMRYQKFLALVDIWACAYYTYRCTTAAPAGQTATAFVDAAGASIQLREAMLEGFFLLLDGVRVPVIIDNTLEELNVGGGNFQSDTYLLPLRGPDFSDTNGQITYLEHFNYRGPYGMQSIIEAMGPTREYLVSSDGRYAVFFLGGTAFCKQVMARTRKRIIVRAPFLAAKLENERYNVYVHEREWQPNTSFFENGGGTSFFQASFHSPISPT